LFAISRVNSLKGTGAAPVRERRGMEAVDRDLPKDAGEGRLSEWFVLHSPALRAFFAKKAGGANAADLVQEVFSLF
jgi:DNA-directed RNA polymerase specialized sigma24 family protein